MKMLEMLKKKKAAAGMGVAKMVLEVVITLAIVVSMYPILTYYINQLNSTFQNAFTNLLAGSGGLISIVLSIGVGYWLLSNFLGKFTGK